MRAGFVVAAATIAATVMASGQVVGAEPSAGAVVPQVVLEVPVAGVAAGAVTVPDDALAAIVNVTATNPVAQGYLTVYPCSEAVPEASNVNYAAGEDVATNALVRLSDSGSICVSTSAPTDVIVDLQGYVPAGSDVVLLDAPRRAVDTRNGIGAPAQVVGGGSTLTLHSSSVGGVPTDAAALVTTTTAADSQAPGFLTIQGCGSGASPTSSLNLVPGRAVPNLVIAPLTGGSTCLTPNAATNIILDVAGYLPAGASGITVLPSPPRLVDTRSGIGSPMAQLAQTPRPLRLAGAQGVPADVVAVIVNLTATRTTTAGFVTVAPCDAPSQVSNVNVNAGLDVANAAILPVDADGTVCASASAPLDLLVDVTGYVTGSDDIVPVSPTRIYDSRASAAPRCGLALIHPAPTLLWVVDVATGLILHEVTNERFDGVGIFKQTLLHAALLPSCDGVLVWNPIDYEPPNSPPLAHRYELLDVKFDGNLTMLGEISAEQALLMFADGMIAVAAGGTYVDIRTGDPIVRLPADRQVTRVLDDGRILTNDPDSTGLAEYWQRRAPDDPMFPDAELVSDGVIVHGVPSPTGRFQLVNDGSGDYRVVTEAGSTVATFTAADVPSMQMLLGFEWYADGTVIVCGRGDETQADGTIVPVRHAIVWNVFTDTSVVWPHHACVVDAR